MSEKTLIVIGATGKKLVKKSAAQMRSKFDDGFEFASKNTGCEAYYVVKNSFVEKLLKTNLFWSNVDPGEPQILNMLNEAGLQPVAVHRSGGTNFGYTESNDFNDICEHIGRKFGTKRILHFQTASNDLCRQSAWIDGKCACRAFGMWQDKVLRNGYAGNDSKLVGPDPVLRSHNKGWLETLTAKAKTGIDDNGAMAEFLKLKTKFV